MKTFITALFIVLTAPVCFAASADAPAPKPYVEVVFVLDSTGSMSGLIEGVKQKIWAIANTIILQQPEPNVRIGVLTYRDRGDAYVTKMIDLSSDIDTVYAFLMEITAGGGGDEPESVNQALDEAVNNMNWSPREINAYRVIFLVGDAPPHMDYPDDVKYPVTCKKAVEKKITINTIQCGNIPSCTPFWQDIAKLAKGDFSQIGQTGNVVVVESPFDKEIAAMTVKLGATVIPYGSEYRKREVLEKLKTAEKASVSAGADRAAYNLRRGGVVIHGTGDLVEDVKTNADLLSDAEGLPEIMRDMSVPERRKFVEAVSEIRQEMIAKIGDLTARRDKWMVAESAKKRPGPTGTGTGTARPVPSSTAPSFDTNVSETIGLQFKRAIKK